jgi:Ca2+-binding RTX toxin-like protein
MFNYNGSQYLLTNFGTWEQAQAQAQSLGGNLVTINTAAEQNFLVSAFGGTEKLWIGLTDKVIEGQFKWASNEISTYTNWFPGQPDNGGPEGEDYVVMNFGAAGQWNDYPDPTTLVPPTAFRGIIEIKQSVNPTPITGTDGDDSLNGTDGNDTLVGFSGNDTLDGGTGSDILIGGLGNDIYIVDNTNDTIIENVGEGTDTIQSSVTYTIATNVENLTLTGTGAINGTGNDANNVITGNDANNSLNGGTGNDTLNGGAGNDILIGGLGNDILIGGLDNDTYIVDSITGTIIENVGQGTDTIESSVTYTIATNVENLTLTGTGAINGTGNAANNVITGNDANNILNGGAGNDTLIGGLDNDTYIVDSTTDIITENVGEGTDTIESSVTYTITAATVENLTLTGTGAINGTGNAANNVITGNDANNILNGGAGNDTLNGGAGNDILIGGLSNDTYIVDSINDTIIENVGEGTDTIESSITYTITAATVENLTLIGTAVINGTGDAGNNVITGNDVNNTLNGGAGNDTLNGGAGNDILIGGSGNDTYVIDSATDTITELASGGTDTIQSSVNYTITAANVENLTLIGTAVINGTGNAGNNVITGNGANNILNGGAGNDILTGGLGKDNLTGGSGVDRFDYRTLAHSAFSIFDVITDFNATTGNDLFLVTTARSGFFNAGSVATLDTTGIAANLTNTVFTANSAAQFTFGTRSFVALNDATAGFSATTDAVIEVTGLTGALSINNFTTTLV